MAKSTIYGVHAVETALRNDAENLGQIWFDKRSRNDRLKKLEKMAEDSGLRLLAMESDKLDKIAGTNKHQGIVAEYYKLKAWTENDLLDLLDGLEEPAFLLVLDGVTDPHNLGACLRTAEGAGVHAVIAPKDNAASITPTVRKVASGAAEIIPFVPVTNLARTLETLKSRGIWLTGTSDKAKQTLYQAELKGSMALVMGAEGAGIRRLTEEACDYLISIPMAGQVSSLNVSVATGVCLYEAVRQRQGAL
ncbi:23S rRNA (guanosine(2251)-2'-O)-methyltransferase RlmB [Candidatus Thiothrix anitrata]|jgi:23S rRNA (guanosine2251-2'-O)-methyltransferase|uniref:23S rRNA (guanosine-2'-O-)-methyltransferase RlmB n=1 Tax=Candidatus Thiothrix anitrata TaxID=2823902 RepID=A0ABX7X307_9GAMM|nr:23S rRNA (guanosine(2251)-2'-O)-methyltransferase RlmB [Candidatus Thiothrix anitrata]QTR49667.1 23S rRNA (guanosine(2251)-2'-O)-methyltransferase RlmB [Candidatus Thiothrix anitrata]